MFCQRLHPLAPKKSTRNCPSAHRAASRKAEVVGQHAIEADQIQPPAGGRKQTGCCGSPGPADSFIQRPLHCHATTVHGYADGQGWSGMLSERFLRVRQAARLRRVASDESQCARRPTRCRMDCNRTWVVRMTDSGALDNARIGLYTRSAIDFEAHRPWHEGDQIYDRGR